MNGVLVGIGLLIAGIWVVRLIYAPVGAYTVFAMFIILLSMAYFSSNPTYTQSAQLIYTT